MSFENIITELAVIYTGAAILSTIFLYLKQPIIISYIFLGILVGPFGLALIDNADHIEQISHLGIILLLFLIGLNLHPNKLFVLFKKTSLVTILTSLIFAIISAIVTYLFGYTIFDSIIVGVALGFSSTVIGLKLIPTSDLHTKHIGEIMISILLFQDILAIIVILFLKGDTSSNLHVLFSFLILKGILISIASFFIVKYIILYLFKKFDVIQEYTFMVALGWCLFVAAISHYFGLSYEIGAFIAGVTLAISPIALVISEKLKSLREFFLILFFFAIGAQFDVLVLKDVLILSIILGILIVVIKPLIYRKAFLFSGENDKISTESAFRLGQASEFSLIVAFIALENSKISNSASYLIQLTVIITFIISTYIVSSKYKTPVSVNKTKRKD